MITHTHDVTPRQVQCMALHVPLVVVETADPDGARALLECGATEVIPPVATASDVLACLRARISGQEIRVVAGLLNLFSEESSVDGADVNAASLAAGVTLLGATRGHPGLRAEHESATDTFEVSDVELARVRDGVVVSESEARGRAEEVLRALAAEGLVGPQDFDATDAIVSTVIQGIGDSSGAPPVGMVKGYRFFIPRRFGGVILNDGGQHDLGIRIVVHRSGTLQSVKLSGLGVEAASSPDSVVRRVDEKTIDRRVEADYPNSTITSLGLRYSLGAKTAEPRQVYKVSRNIVVDGEVTHERAVMVHCSVTDDSLAPYVWPKAGSRRVCPSHAARQRTAPPTERFWRTGLRGNGPVRMRYVSTPVWSTQRIDPCHAPLTSASRNRVTTSPKARIAGPLSACAPSMSSSWAP